jgi:signal transduction histidine kinase
MRPEVLVALESRQDGALLAVRDTCGGIAGEELDRLFDRYFRGQSASEIRGLGLGLFVAHRSADAMAWSIDVQTYAGDGCEFRIAMPARLPARNG